MEQLQVFKNEIFKVTAKVESDVVLFDVEQVAKCLGFVQIKNNREYVRWETINRYLTKYLSQEVGKGDLIPEAMVYKLAFKASNEIAEEFQDWLAVEVLPSIKKHGAYMTAQTIEQALLNPDTLIQLATTLKDEQQKRRQAEQIAIQANQIIEQQKPKVMFADAIVGSHSSILIRELAVLLKQNGIDMGQGRLFDYLRSNGYLVKRAGTDSNMPTQKSMNLGLFEIKETPIVRSTGTTISKTPKVTAKGQRYFINHFLKKDDTA